VPNVLKSGSLNLLEPSGPVQACNEIALPFKVADLTRRPQCDPRLFEIYGGIAIHVNEELNDLYSLSNIVRVVKSRRMRWAGHVARMGEDRGVHRVLVGEPEGKRTLGRPRLRWEDNIKMKLQEVGGGLGEWMKLAQDRDRWRALVGTVRDFWVP